MADTHRCPAGHAIPARRARFCTACRRDQIIARVLVADPWLPEQDVAAEAADYLASEDAIREWLDQLADENRRALHEQADAAYVALFITRDRNVPQTMSGANRSPALWAGSQVPELVHRALDYRVREALNRSSTSCGRSNWISIGGQQMVLLSSRNEITSPK